MIVLLGATEYVGAAFARATHSGGQPWIAISRRENDYSRYATLVPWSRRDAPGRGPIGRILKAARQFVFWESDAEFYRLAAAAPRSNCILNSDKLSAAGEKLRPVEEAGQTYNIGGHNERANLRIVEAICDLCDELVSDVGGDSRRLITFVQDRPGRDRRYAVDAGKIERELGWRPQYTFERGLQETVAWILEYQDWVARVQQKGTQD